MVTTRVLPVSAAALGEFDESEQRSQLALSDWTLSLDKSSQDAAYLREAARAICNDGLPVAFPTETVYGLGADATNSSAVRGIFEAKRRPADNPLIVHVASITQLETLLNKDNDAANCSSSIPEIYLPLIEQLWPGPLTILLPLGKNSPLAPEVTAGQSTFGVRMPRHLLALALIKLSGVPIAAPSANASGRPSPTTAEHVKHDLDGRVSIVLDGGPCDVGLESTVVDGLCDPPQILRPGGISLEQIRTCPGWEHTVIAYSDQSLRKSDDAPRAPGMKYRHYAPNARVLLYEAGSPTPDLQMITSLPGHVESVGIIRTSKWQKVSQDRAVDGQSARSTHDVTVRHAHSGQESSVLQQMLLESAIHQANVPTMSEHELPTTTDQTRIVRVWDIMLGPDIKAVARGLFSALRDLDKCHVDCILVEGINPNQGDTAGAIMNRLRKAAED